MVTRQATNGKGFTTLEMKWVESESHLGPDSKKDPDPKKEPAPLPSDKTDKKNEK